MKVVIIFISLCLFSTNIFSYSLNGYIPGQGERIHYIALFNKTQYELLDSVVTNKSGRFSIDIPFRYKGIIKVILKDDRNVNETINESLSTQTLYFLSDGKDISFKAYWGFYSEDLIIMKGKKTINVAEKVSCYLNKEKKKLNLMNNLMEAYSPGDKVFKVVGVEYTNGVKQQQQYCDSVMNEYSKNSIVRSYVSLLKPLYIPIELSQKEKDQWRVTHFFDHVNFSDENLLHLPDFYLLINQYINFSKPRGLSKMQEIDSGIKEAVEIILSRSKENQKLYLGVFDILKEILRKGNKEYILVQNK
jgi:hypothetical protein